VGKELTWTTSFNFSVNRNKITDLKGQVITGSGDAVNRAVEGQPLGIFYTVEFAGVDPANGDALYYKNTDLGGGNWINQLQVITIRQTQWLLAILILNL